MQSEDKPADTVLSSRRKGDGGILHCKTGRPPRKNKYMRRARDNEWTLVTLNEKAIDQGNNAYELKRRNKVERADA